MDDQAFAAAQSPSARAGIERGWTRKRRSRSLPASRTTGGAATGHWTRAWRPLVVLSHLPRSRPRRANADTRQACTHDIDNSLAVQGPSCWRALKTDPGCALNFDPPGVRGW